MKKFLASLLAVVLLAAMFVIPAAAETEALSIVVDADPEDNGWSREEADWTLVDPENGYWQSVPTTDASVEYVYQMRSDGEKLYVAVAVNCALKEGGNGSGTNIRLWLKTNDEATVYTHFFDVYAGGFSAKMNVKNATHLGLLPRELSDRFCPINNSSLLGTIKFALGDIPPLEEITSRAEFTDIGADKLFSELFFENMMFLS